MSDRPLSAADHTDRSPAPVDAATDRPRRRPGSGQRSGSRVSPWRVAIGVGLLALVVRFLVIPMFVDSGDAWDTLRSIDPYLGSVAIAVQVLWWYLNGWSIRLLLPRSDRPSRWVFFGSATAAEGLSRLLPAGGAGTVFVNYKLLEQAGVPDDELVYAMSASAVTSALALNVMLGISLAFAIPLAGPDLPYPLAIALGIVLIVAVAALLWALVRRTGPTSELVGRVVGWIPRLDGDAASAAVRNFAEQVKGLLADPWLLFKLAVVSALRWLVAAAVAFVVFVAIGDPPNVFGLFVAFALATVVAAIPVSPGGLGVFEATMIATLVAFGTAQPAATAGVFAFRAVSFWLAIPVGSVAYAWVNIATRRGRGVAKSAA